MSNHSSATVTAVATNEARLLKSLRAAFSGAANVVKELAQNARRAGATRLDITAGPMGVSFVDDGCGIADFTKLLEIGTSGWEEELRDAEGAYGLGFAAALYSARSIDVCSGGYRLRADTDRLLAREPVELEPVPLTAGTRVTLFGLAKPVMQLFAQGVEQLFEGFPIDVYLNGRRLERPHAPQDLATQTPFGTLRVVGGDPLPEDLVLYLQGFLVEHRRHFSKPVAIVHLDARRFKGRMPDRERLLDHEETAQQIRREYALWASEQLEQARRSMTAEAFVERYADACLRFAPKLLNDVPLVPRGMLAKITRTFDARDVDNGLMLEDHEAPLSDTAIGIVVDVDASLEAGSYGALFAWQLDYWVATPSIRRLDAGHWLRRRIQTLELEDFTLSAEHPSGSAEIWPSACWDAAKLVACDAVTITHVTLGSVRVTDHPVYTGHGIDMCDPQTAPASAPASAPEPRMLYVPGVSAIHSATQLIEDGIVDERYDELEFERLESALYRDWMTARNAPAADRLMRFLVDHAAHGLFKSVTFMVGFNETGALSVIESPVAAMQ